ncbi:DUF2163 domain-containing protein [Neoehrlichia mikurensis]|uniref:DUF2163 domain-containing protein n=1 Tax=Neoehrlichia mikurensis TaxID=89586 RepID=A0A9Q9BZV3_9RICK|nr:DUF2163 domain-containing protein [Neoehrlichia mikurensis]QXK92102.1 DUF2163 domain-containing protein [Neoehrlichia mikurensis]QXK92559.1 DUF2163 domain-containing protein [Neoehrlichia mikurensis]QXK93795.1 DUF2163 domain-containing protein [Neoehrlichia mikurensis]UTO55229.1 DUF2163 domain-containing protein [Neoehrlichia mikurensis]UTO56149.1 DUF2163 domain-containing protein [Neoehrlichia mikurensis]
MEITNKNLTKHLSQNIITIAYCWKIILKNNSIIGFTNHDKDLIINNITYHAKSGTQIHPINFNIISEGQTKIESVINSDLIDVSDIIHGKYDSSHVEIFIINYENISQGILTLFTGIIHKITLNNDKFIAELKGLSNILSHNITNVFSPQCRAQFCDNQCKSKKEKFTVISVITNIIHNNMFEDINLLCIDNYYKYGTVTFLTGKNLNISLSVISNKDKYIQLAKSPPYPMYINDKYSIIAGCDKNYTTCHNKFNNTKNFRGEPHIPDTNTVY